MKTEEALKFAGGDTEDERKANAERIANAATDFDNFRSARLGTSSGMAELLSTNIATVTDEDGTTTKEEVKLSLAQPDPISVPDGFDPEANQRQAEEDAIRAERETQEETEARIAEEVERRVAEERARMEAEAQANAEAEARARADAEAQANAEAEAQARAEAERNNA